MQLSLRTFTSLVEDMAATVQGRAAKLVDFGAGSVTRAILEATASTALWLQYVGIQILLTARLSTSTGSDVDSFVADYGLARLPAVAATGQVTLSRYAPTGSASVPVGAIVRTGDASQSFAVTADATNPAFDVPSQSYLVPAGVASVTVPVQAQVAGAAGNVSAGAIVLVGSAVPGINLVSNAAGLANGANAESDDALKARFQAYIASLSKSTLTAVEAAVAGVEQGLTYSVAENADEAGGWRPGHFVVTLDDGSGTPSDALKSQVYAAVDAVRPIASTFSVQSPQVLVANVSMSITPAPGVSKAALVPVIAQAVTDYVDALGVGTPLPLTMLAVTAYGAQPGAVRSVSLVSVNGDPVNDITPGPRQTVKVGTVTVL